MLIVLLIVTLICLIIIKSTFKKASKPNHFNALFNKKEEKVNDEESKFGDEDEEDDLQKVNVKVWKKILKLVLKKKSNIILMGISVFLCAAMDVLTPFVNSKVIATFFSENPNFDLKWFYIGIYVAIGVVYIFSIYSFVYRAGQVEVQVGYEIRKEAFEKLQELPFSYYDNTPSGWIMARLTSDSRKLSEIISWGIVDLVWGFITMTGYLVIMYCVNAKLALIITCLLPFMFLIGIFFTRKILKEYRVVRKTNSLITGYYNESVLGAKTTKTLTLEDSRSEEFKGLTGKMKKQSLRAILISGLFWPCILCLGYIGVASVLGVGSLTTLGVLSGIAITADVLYLFVNYATSFFDPILNISRIFADLQQAEASAERIIGLIETKVDITDTDEVIEKYGDLFNPKFENFESINGDVEFKNVKFSYTEQEVVLKDFNLKVDAGTSVALVGTTGAGKSTIVNLLCRFYEPVSGDILIDGIDYRQRSRGWLHHNLGYVLQEPHLFSGSIKENIAYGKPDATMEEIIDAATKAQAIDFINELPNGFDTLVGEGGAKLSVGQRQLICIARVILINPSILIFDEATSSIDTETEVKIQEVIQSFMKGRTTFVVAHRLSTIVNSDLILVIENGEIKEQGTHKDLLKLKGTYYNLYKTQFISERIDKSYQ